MRKHINSLDLMFLTKELKERVENAKIREIKQNDKNFCLEIYKLGKFNLKIILPYAIYLTPLPFESQKQPSSFCMLLRKHLVNKTIKNFSQHEFDRIVEIEVGDYKLIIELFDKGNLILLDKDSKVIGCLISRKWKDREIKMGLSYTYPPSPINPFFLSLNELSEILSKKDYEIVKVLAKDFGLGGNYAEELCKRVGILKIKKASSLSEGERKKLWIFFNSLKRKEPEGFIIFEDESLVDVVSIDLSIYEKNFKIYTKGLNSALETFFEKAKEKMKREEEKIEDYKLRTIIEKQEERLKELKGMEEKYKKIAQIIQEKYDVFEKILNDVVNWRETYRSWEGVEKLIEEEGGLKEVLPSQARIIVKLNGMEIPLDFRKSVRNNLEEYFEKIKKIKGKIERLEERLKELKTSRAPREKSIELKRKKWYEDFRWFRTSDDFLVVAGKDARTNDLLIRKYVERDDLVLHADIRGSPFGVIKNEKKIEIPKRSVEEAAQFIASYSKAWSMGIGNVDVYWVKPEQVIRSVWLPLGSFIIEGRRNWIRKVKLSMGIGVKRFNDEIELVKGPSFFVKNQTPYWVEFFPGGIEGDELAKKIKEKLIEKVPDEIKLKVAEISLEEIKSSIPYNRGNL